MNVEADGHLPSFLVDVRAAGGESVERRESEVDENVHHGRAGFDGVAGTEAKRKEVERTLNQARGRSANRLTEIEEVHAAHELDEELVGRIGYELEGQIEAPYRGALRVVVDDDLQARIEGKLLLDDEPKRNATEKPKGRS